jgi:mannose-6-phosphate isomerase-like protein (cupin superfamily)
MSIEPGKDIGLEVHNDTDQFLRVEAGTADVTMGSNEGQLTVQKLATEMLLLSQLAHGIT